MTAAPILTLRDFGVAFAGRVVLADLSLDLPRVGLTTLVGPAGSGKSTLLRTLAGLNDTHPELDVWGTAVFDGDPLEQHRPIAAGEARPGIGVVTQQARFFMDSIRENLVASLPNRAAFDRPAQTSWVRSFLVRHGLSELVSSLDDDVASLPTHVQRRLAIARALVAEPSVLFADEPTSGLEDVDAVEVLELLRVQASLRSVLLVTHNQRFARAYGGSVVLLSGGRIREAAPAAQFFDEPKTEPGRAFVRTGSCPDPSPAARREDLDSRIPPPLPTPVTGATSRSAGPRGFFWVMPGRLGGLPRPGIVDPLESDVEGLARLGVTTLVTLEETGTVDPTVLQRAGIASIHFPIPDMGAPDLESAGALATLVADCIRAGGVVALHCRAGLGRTGTLLATQLIFDGERAVASIERIRRLNPKCIQSQAQVAFLSSFEAFIRGARADSLTD